MNLAYNISIMICWMLSEWVQCGKELKAGWFKTLAAGRMWLWWRNEFRQDSQVLSPLSFRYQPTSQLNAGLPNQTNHSAN